MLVLATGCSDKIVERPISDYGAIGVPDGLKNEAERQRFAANERAMRERLDRAENGVQVMEKTGQQGPARAIAPGSMVTVRLQTLDPFGRRPLHTYQAMVLLPWLSRSGPEPPMVRGLFNERARQMISAVSWARNDIQGAAVPGVCFSPCSGFRDALLPNGNRRHLPDRRPDGVARGQR
ncbi:MAG: hypothetical protein R3E68_18315 [Burkholderiaceae bacterium]